MEEWVEEIHSIEITNLLSVGETLNDPERLAHIFKYVDYIRQNIHCCTQNNDDVLSSI